ncbi:Something about silencing protein 10, partial [Sesbania bispinosa]
MGKRGKAQSKKYVKNTKTSSRYEHNAFSSDDMDDEIDAFHKKRDIVPLDVNGDAGESDEDDELPIFDFKLQSSDDEAPKEEEELALQIQREKAKSLTMEDYDLVDISEDKDNEKMTLKDASYKGKREIKSLDRDIAFRVEDLNALSKEEQMNIVY